MKLRRSPRSIKAASSSVSALKPRTEPSESPSVLKRQPKAYKVPVCKKYSYRQKPYTMNSWICTHSGSEYKLRAVLSVPISQSPGPLLPDHEINSIIAESTSLREPVLEPTPISPGKGKPLNRKGVAYVLGNFQFRFVGTHSDVSPNHSLSRLPQDASYIDKFTNRGALFILLVPTNELVEHMHRKSFTDRFPCAVVSAEGSPKHLIKMEKDLNIPVLALLSTDSKSLRLLAYYGRRLKNFKWLGVRPTDTVGLCQQRCRPPSIDSPNIKDKFPYFFHTPRLTKKDEELAASLLKDDYFSRRPQWDLELAKMSRMMYKVEVEYLTAVSGLDYLTEWYLPLKLQEQDWI